MSTTLAAVCAAKVVATPSVIESTARLHRSLASAEACTGEPELAQEVTSKVCRCERVRLADCGKEVCALREENALLQERHAELSSAAMFVVEYAGKLRKAADAADWRLAAEHAEHSRVVRGLRAENERVEAARAAKEGENSELRVLLDDRKLKAPKSGCRSILRSAFKTQNKTEAAHAQEEVARLRAEIAALERIVCAQDDEFDACKAERDELRADVEDLVQYASHVERERDELLADVDELAQYARDVMRERDEMCQDAKELAQYACDLSRERDEHAARADEAEAKFAQLCDAADEAFQHADDAVVRCHELEGELRSLEGEVTALQDQLVQKEDVIVRIRRGANLFKRQLEDAHITTAGLRAAAERAEARLASLTAERDQALSEAEQLRDDAIDALEENAALCAANDGLRADNDALRTSLANLVAECHQLEAELRDLLDDAIPAHEGSTTSDAEVAQIRADIVHSAPQTAVSTTATRVATAFEPVVYNFAVVHSSITSDFHSSAASDDAYASTDDDSNLADLTSAVSFDSIFTDEPVATLGSDSLFLDDDSESVASLGADSLFSDDYEDVTPPTSAAPSPVFPATNSCDARALNTLTSDDVIVYTFLLGLGSTATSTPPRATTRPRAHTKTASISVENGPASRLFGGKN